MISRFFIDRPIFATVLSVVITLIGGISLFFLPVAQYPRITPPGVNISISYPGASAQVVADTVGAPIEQQVNGVEGMLYMSSQSGNDGTYSLTVTFDIGTDLNTAVVKVQNRVALAMPQLPTEVQNQGITIRKKTPDILMIVNFFSPNGRYDDIYLSNYATIHVRVTPPPTELVSQKTVSLYEGTSNGTEVSANSPVLPERSNYFDAGIIQKITPALNVGVDGYYKITTDLIDEGQFGQALIYAPFNYAQGSIEGLELTGNYHSGNFTTYTNVAITVSLGKDVVSGQYNFSQAELNYIASNWIHCDHDQFVTFSSGISYRLWETLFSADATYGSGLRSGFANTQTVPYNVQINLAAKRKFNLWEFGPVEARLTVLNVLDRANEIRTGTGIGVFAPQYGPRIGILGGISKSF